MRIAAVAGAGALALVLTGCVSGGVTGSGVDAFVAEVHEAVPQTQAYERDTLENVAFNVCSRGSLDLAVGMLEIYPKIPAADREAVARIAMENVCAD